ncbi:hypothetical protein L596_008729 [Steinernema carpocapsae]|uniref:BAR domain-containing protein n=1 Tax=Steinernema carpocapsae TaxID=34508 RepID=A0A4U5PDG0_STECR|nr:hypothetical protein L596_008729 [Steinernema carpocapsae]
MASSSKDVTLRSSRQATASSSRGSNKEAMPSGGPVGGVPQNGSGFKRFMFKISEKVGSRNKTEYSAQFLEACKEMEKYKVVVDDLCLRILGVVQQNPRFIPQPLGKMCIEPPPNEAPFEGLSVALAEIQPFMDSKYDLSKQQGISDKLAKLQREFLERTRRCLHHLRTFVSEEYLNYEQLRRDLERSRQEMDFSKHELKNAKNAEQIQAKNMVYERASKHFEEQLQKVNSFLEQFPTLRESHYKDVLTFFFYEKKYFDDCAKILKGG